MGTPNNIDYIFYTRQFFNTLSVLAYPEEDLEKCNLPGWKYPSDHFAHMATFQERDDSCFKCKGTGEKDSEEACENCDGTGKGSPARNENIALLEEMFHLLMRENAVPSTDTIIRDAEGEQVRVDYTYDCDSKLAHKEITRENMLAVFKKCRPFYTELIRGMIPRCVECNGTGKQWGYTGWSPCAICDGSGLPAAENTLLNLKHFVADQGETYINCVKDQATRMNKHNKKRIIMEKEGEEYRTYTILKALYNLNKAKAGYRNTKGAVIDEVKVNATATDMLSFIVGKCKGKCEPGKSSNKNVPSARLIGRSAMISKTVL